MRVALLKIKQVRELAGKYLSDVTTFNPIVDKLGNVVISEEEINECNKPEFAWVKNLIVEEYDELIKPINTTPPASNGNGLVIPTRFQWAFPITLNGFTIELKTKGADRYVEQSILTWADFNKELRKAQNDDFRALIKPIRDFLVNQATVITL